MFTIFISNYSFLSITHCTARTTNYKQQVFFTTIYLNDFVLTVIVVATYGKPPVTIRCGAGAGLAVVAGAGFGVGGIGVGMFGSWLMS